MRLLHSLKYYVKSYLSDPKTSGRTRISITVWPLQVALFLCLNNYYPLGEYEIPLEVCIETGLCERRLHISLWELISL